MYKSTSTTTHSEITHDLFYHILCFRPQKKTAKPDDVMVVYGMVKGIKVSACVRMLEVVIIMCGLNRFPLRVLTKNPFFCNFKIIIFTEIFYSEILFYFNDLKSKFV